MQRVGNFDGVGVRSLSQATFIMAKSPAILSTCLDKEYSTVGINVTVTATLVFFLTPLLFPYQNSSVRLCGLFGK